MRALIKRSTVTLPANIQYAWPHPSREYFYIVSSNGGPGVAGDKHYANALPGRSGFGRADARMASRNCCRRGRSIPASTRAGQYC